MFFTTERDQTFLHPPPKYTRREVPPIAFPLEYPSGIVSENGDGHEGKQKCYYTDVLWRDHISGIIPENLALLLE